MPEKPVYEEKVSSARTEVLFVALALFFLALFCWRLVVTGPGIIAGVFLLFLLLFTFYALSYRFLVIRISTETLNLKFGVFGWTIPLHSIEKIYVDDISLWRISGAGIHFSSISGRYRAMLNFLEHQRLVVVLKEKRGPVKDVAFSTGKPNEIMRIIGSFTSNEGAG